MGLFTSKEITAAITKRINVIRGHFRACILQGMKKGKVDVKSSNRFYNLVLTFVRSATQLQKHARFGLVDRVMLLLTNQTVCWSSDIEGTEEEKFAL